MTGSDDDLGRKHFGASDNDRLATGTSFGETGLEFMVASGERG